MAYDEELETRLRRLLPRATSKRMFGGVGFMERGHLVAGVSHNDLIVRVPADETERWLGEPGAHPMMAGKAMKGWLKVASTHVRDDSALGAWVGRSRSAVRLLPPK